MPDDMDETGDISDHGSEIDDESESFAKEDDKMFENPSDGASGIKKKYDPKDPLRPRRKKARRACFACQRAHLTCGDERPCKRCIKRGLADACQDGVRKKAKYLHDAPEEALGPVLGPNYNTSASRARPNGQRQNSAQSDLSATSHGGSFLGQSSAASFPVYPAETRGRMGIPEGISFNPQPSPISPSFQANPVAAAQPQVDGILQGNPMSLNALFDPSNPALYNFDLEGLDFGSQYAGWEFGILNKMVLGAETSPRENSMSQTPSNDANLAALFANGAGGAYDSSGLLGGEYAAVDAGASFYTQGNLQHGLPHAYAIAARPTGITSPSTDATSSSQTALDGSPSAGAFGGASSVPDASRNKSKQDKIAQSILGKRQRDSAAIYASVKEPYPYTAGFHNMIAVLHDRLPLEKLVHIVRSLGEIRPSFIACTKSLTREDLVFIEKCFQRTLVEFDDFLQHCCAPTIVCRRSGEVAAVNKEFTALTGLTKGGLLGKEPNRNVHVRCSSSAEPNNGGDEGNRTDESTPGAHSGATEAGTGGRHQPVFLAELLDDSVVQFYRDFAQLAFEDSRGKVQRNCCLMKYRTQEEIDGKDDSSRKDDRTSILSSRVTRIDGEHGISRIEKDGKVSCTYCWTIKRDVFDIPMMILMNFLPRYYTNQEPHQLAV